MKKILLIGLMGLMGLMPLRAQMIIDTWTLTTGVDTTLWMDLSSDYTTLIATTMGSSQNYGSSGLRDIGFPFTLGATTHTKFSTNVNGTVRLGTSLLPSAGYIEEPLGQNITAGPRIDAFGRAAMFDQDCYMRSAVLGDSGSRVLVVETRLRDYGNRSVAEGDERYVMFQVQLFEAGGLRIVYGQADSGAIYGDTQNGVAATGNNSNKDVIFFDFASQRAVRFNGNCTLRNAVEHYPAKGHWYMLAPDPTACPRATASTVWVTNYSAAGVELTQSTTDAHSYRVRVPGTDIDTLWDAAQATFTLPPLNPLTDYTLAVQTLCGSDTSYRTFDYSITTGCGSVVQLPWSTDFATLSHSDCWDMPYVSGSNADFTRRWRFGSGRISCPSAAGTYNSWLKSPVFFLPDTDGLTFKWDYRALATSGISPYVELRVAPCNAAGTVASDADWVTLRSFADEVASYKTFYATLDAWRGQTVRVAFVRTGEGGGTAYIDDVSLYQQQAPVFEWEVPTMVLTGDTALMTAAWLAGVDSNVTWSWHSALMDTTMVIVGSSVSMASLVYTVAGWDTVTLTVSNVYGSDSAQAVVDVLNCGTIATFPWIDDFTHSSNCWSIDGWTFQGSVAAYDADGLNRNCSNVYYASNTDKYMLMQPVAVPATGAEHLSLWVEADGPLMVRVSPTEVLDTTAYTDTLLIVPDVSSRKEIWWRTASLAAYAGQTVRAGLFKMDGTQAFVSAVKVDFDTLPVLGMVSVASRSRTDSTNICRAELRYGATDGLTFTWHSSLMDTTWVDTPLNSLLSTFSLTYTIGGEDTVTVVVANAYGTDTLVRTLHVTECSPVTALPWHDGFEDGTDCWYLTQSKTYHQWTQSYYGSHNHCVGSQCNFSESDTVAADAWLVSKAIDIPADTALDVRLFWSVGLSSGSNLTNVYRIMVTTAADFADTTAYDELYCDTTPLPNMWGGGLAQRSVSLAAYAGQTVHLAFRNQPVVRRATALVIDDVEVRATAMPMVTLASDAAEYFYGDTACFTATLVEGDTAGLTYTWHSSLLDSTIVGSDTLHRCYGLVNGLDTVTVVATNAFGSDTATVVVTSTIINQPQVVSFSAEEKIFFLGEDMADAGDTLVYLISRNPCVTTGLAYSLHSTLLDSTVTVATTADTCRIVLVYPLAGVDTLTAYITNSLATSAPAELLLTVSDCPVAGVPFFEDFDGEGNDHDYIPCWPGKWWYAPLGNNRGAGNSGAASQPYFMSPAIDLPDSLGLQLSWYTNPSTAVPVRIRVSPTGSKHIADFTDTLFFGTVANGGYDSASLDAYRGQRIRLAFVNAWYSSNIYDDIRIDYNRTAPQVSLDMPAVVMVGDTVTISATLNSCSTQGLSVSWQSTLLDSTWTTYGFDGAYGFNGAYGSDGWDTVTVIVSNAYGSDTAVAVFHVVDCSRRSLPYSEDFESVAATGFYTAGTLPSCWDYRWTGSNATYAPHVITASGFQYMSNLPDNALLMAAGNASGYAPIAIVALPHMADSEHNLSIAFDYRFESSGQGELAVGYDDGTLFTPVQVMTPYASAYHRDTVVLPPATDPDARIALRWMMSSSWYTVAIDNIEVFQTPASALAPHVTISGPANVETGDTVQFTASITSNAADSLTVTWHSTLLDSTWAFDGINVVYGQVGTDTITVIVSNPYGADTAMHVVGVYDCGNVVLPYYEDFDGVVPATTWSSLDGTLPQCWRAESQVAGANILKPQVVSSYQYISNLPSNALLMVAAGNNSAYSPWVQAVLPQFDAPLQNTVFAFDYRFESVNAGTLTVGYAYDTNYVAVDTLTPYAAGYQHAEVGFADVVAPAGARIAMRFERESYFYGMVVDNIEVFRDSSEFAPAGFAVDSVSAHCVTLSWQPYTGATAYHVTIGTTVDTTVSGTTVTLCGLDEATAYVAGVAPVVAGAIGYHATVAFTTLPYCSALSGVTYAETDGNLVLTCQFDGTGEASPAAVNIAVTDLFTGTQWQTVGTGTGDTLTGIVAGHGYRVVVTALCGGVAMMGGDTLEFTMTNACSEVRGDYNDTYNFLGYYDQYAFNQMIYPAQMLGSVDTLFGIALRVSTAAPYNSDRKVNVFIDHTASTSLASAAVSVTGMTQTAHTADFNTADTGWTAILFDTPFVYNGVDNLIVTVVDVTGRSSNGLGIGMHSYQGDSYRYLLWLSSGETINPYNLNFTTSYNYYRAPDIQFLGGCTNERCVAPAVVVDSATSNALYLSWQRRGNESHYQVEYSVAGADSWTIADTTTATSYTLAGLADGTLYQVRVGAVCDDSTVLYRTATVAGTLCGPVSLPHYSDFAIAPGHCWTSTGSYSENNGYNLSGVSFDNPNMLISPEVAGGLHAASVTIRARDYSSYDDARYAVGVSNADGSEVVWIDTVDFSDYNSFEDATVYLNSYTGPNNHVAIAGILSYTLVRSVNIDPLVGCLPVQRVWANRITDTSATLHWIPEQTGDYFLVYLDDSLMATTTATSFTFTGLVASTTYTARVVEQCSDGGMSVPVSIDFTTACTPLALPWSEDFTSVAIGEMPSCWTTHLTRRYTTTAQVAWPDSWYLGSCRYLHLKSVAGTAANPDTTYKNYASTPLLNVGSHGAVVTISAQGNYGSLLQVGVMTDPSDPSTFVPALDVPLHPSGFNCSNFMTYQFSTDTLDMLPDVWSVAFHWTGVSVSMVSEVSVDPIIVPTHDLTLAVNDTTMGTVSGAGTYDEGTVVTVTAMPNSGFRFDHWSDGETAAVRTIKMDYDMSLTAYFEPDTVWHTVTITALMNDGSPYDGLDAMVSGAGTYADGDTVTLEGEVQGCSIGFVYWVTAEGDTLYDNPYTFVIHSDMSFTAVFMQYGGIGDVEGNDWTLYPNPTQGDVTVSVSQPSTLTVLDVAGRVVIAPTPVTSTLLLPTSDLPAGIYFVRMGESVKKLIVK